ncbi:MAG: sulfite exporter TauE/SafE family protein, partial [Gammaproteobacteria bacterium]|nr:sulfite exporter TauE/SafE family protein [Gammaproteobacteria bacterium]
VGRKFLPIKNYHGALIAGVIWGWIPCGMVYTALVWTLTASSSTQGALLMVSFGLGTVPAMLFMGLAAGKLVGTLQKPLVRHIAGVTVIAFGIYSLWRVL